MWRVFVLTALLLAACSKIPSVTTRTVSGEIFIVTKGRANVRLGRVDVSVYDANELALLFTATSEGIAEQRLRLRQLQDQLQPTFGAAHARYDAFRQSRWDLHNPDPRVTATVQRDAEAEAIKAERMQSELQAFGHTLSSALPYFRHLPKQALGVVKTDSNGRFVLTVPRGRNLVVVASTDRAVFNDTEIYFWTVRVPNDRNTITLSNDNQTSELSSESLLHTTGLTAADLELASTSSLEQKQQEIMAMLGEHLRSPSGRPAPTARHSPK